MKLRQIAFASALTLVATLAQAYPRTDPAEGTILFSDVVLSEATPADLPFQVSLDAHATTFALSTGWFDHISSFEVYSTSHLGTPLVKSMQDDGIPFQWLVSYNALSADRYVARITGTGTATVEIQLGASLAPVPEPEAAGLALAGLLVAGAALRSRKASA